MVDSLPDANPMKADLRSIEHLEAYATAYRYPSTSGNIYTAPIVKKVQEELDKVMRIFDTVVSRFQVDINKPDAPAGNAGPLR